MKNFKSCKNINQGEIFWSKVDIKSSEEYWNWTDTRGPRND